MCPRMSYDVVVVGGGPAGLYAAARLAERGFSVVVCEEHADPGQPVHCTGVMGADAFDDFGLPRDTILNPLTTARFYSPSGLEVSYTPPTVQAVVIDRRRFDERLAGIAAAAGAELRMRTRVSGIDVTADGARVRTDAGELSARLVVVACGATYAFQRQLGLGLPTSYLITAQRELPAKALGDVELHFGAAVAPGGFAWAVPVRRPDGPRVRIGVMATREAVGWYRAMTRRLAERWGLESADDERPRVKFLPLRSIERTYGDRLLVIGDAAGLVKPTTGGGIYYSVLSAMLASEVAAGALAADRLDDAALAPYQARWRKRLSREFQAQGALRSIAQRMSDRQIDALFQLALSDGVMPLVRKTASFNHHRPLIQALLRHAPARGIFWPAFSPTPPARGRD